MHCNIKPKAIGSLSVAQQSIFGSGTSEYIDTTDQQLEKVMIANLELSIAISDDHISETNEAPPGYVWKIQK